MIQLGFRPTLSGLDVSYYREIPATDPVLGLAGLRIELETLARNLARVFKIDVGERDSVSRVLSRLRDAGAITGDQMILAQKVLRLCNQAVHGRTVSREEADDVISAVDVLARDYLSWLSWGFDDNWKPSQS